MKHEENGLDDFLLPDEETMGELELFADENNVMEIEEGSPRGAFSDSPERASLWIEKASRHFIAA